MAVSTASGGLFDRFCRHGLDPASLPASPGTYALVMSIETAVEIEIGALGRRALAAGTYVYCGSALGPGGLHARVGRHLRTEKARRWHVDYLLAAATVVGVWVCESSERLECVLAAALAARDGSTRPIPGFGASDCGCPGHLVRVPEYRLTRGLAAATLNVNRLQAGSGCAH
jgi:Uri superfamily endonuclease